MSDAERAISIWSRVFPWKNSTPALRLAPLPAPAQNRAEGYDDLIHHDGSPVPADGCLENILQFNRNFVLARGLSPKKGSRKTTMVKLRSLSLCVLAGLLLSSTALIAQTSATAARITGPIDQNQLVTLRGNVVPAANSANDRGPVSASLPMSDMIMVLSRSPEQQAAFDAFVASQYDQNSPNYHHWLLPDEVGERFGPAESDIAAITGWLAGQGFAVTSVSPDRMAIHFSGTAGQVETAFHTQIHNLSVKGKAHIANMTDPQIPAALSAVVVGVKGLHNFLPHPLHKIGSLVQFNSQMHAWQRTTSAIAKGSLAGSAAENTASSASVLKMRPQFGFTGGSGNNTYLEEDIAPYDFATIYDVLPLWNKNINGSGQTIAIAGTSDINLSDVSAFKSTFGLPAGLAPEEVKGANGKDPGECTSTSSDVACGIGDLEENSLDVEWAGAVAPQAQVVLVTSGYNSQTNPTNDPIYQSSEYVVDNVSNQSSPVYNAHILSVSYGECELGQGTASNVAYYDLWQSAAAEGISVFVASGDSGSASCDADRDVYGIPYSAQYGLSVSGLASTPYNTAVGGTDFSWCKPVYNSSGTLTGCATSTSNAGPYWNTSNSSSEGQESAAGYVPEIPWNDTCTNPIWAAYLESLAPLTGYTTPANAEAACNFVYNDWYPINEQQVEQGYGQFVLAPFIDTVGGSGGASNCVVNDTATDPDNATCSSGATGTGITTNPTTGVTEPSIQLVNDGWPAPSWQVASGVTGTSGLTTRAIPDVSFFAGDGDLDSATLICVSAAGTTCSSSDTSSSTLGALEVGGTSVATPEMAGVMALINQNAHSPQGLPNPELYELASRQTYSECSAESVKSTSAACYFNDIDQGTNAMPCDYQGEAIEGGAILENNGYWDTDAPGYQGLASPNCAALNSGDAVGTLVSSGTTPGYNAVTGFDLATGLGSLNVANVVNGWSSTSGSAQATLGITLTPTGTITSTTALTVAVTVTGTSGTPTGSIVVSGGGYTSPVVSLSSGAASVTIPAGSLAPGSDTVTITYSGDSNYASTSQQETVSVAAAVPTVAISAPNPANTNNPISVTVTVSGPVGSTTPTGTVTLAQTGGAYSSTAASLSSGSATITIPAGSLTSGLDTLTATYSGDSLYTSASGSTQITIVGTALATPSVTVTASPTSPDSSQPIDLTVKVAGTSGTPTGTVTLTSPTINPAPTATLDATGSAALVIPGGTFTSTGTANISVSYGGDATYALTTGSTSVNVTQSAFTISASAPASVSPGSSTTSTITVSSISYYSGTITFSCQATSGPTDADIMPTCSASPVTLNGNSSTESTTTTLSISTTSNSAMLDRKPAGPGWLGMGGGTVLAFLVFFGIPARRRTWRAMLGLVLLLGTLGGLSACGGGVAQATFNGTAPGNYILSIQATGNDVSSTTANTTVTLTVN